MYEWLACVYACVQNTYRPKKKKKKALGPLELELWMFVSSHVDSGNETLVLCKSYKCS